MAFFPPPRPSPEIPSRMPPEHFGARSLHPSSLEPTSQRDLRPLTTLLLAARSTTTSTFSPGLIGGLVAIGILVLLCLTGIGLVLHVHYCRQSGCLVCCAAVGFKQWRRHPVQVYDRRDRVQTRRNEYSQTPRDRVTLFEPSIQDVRMTSPTSFLPLTPPPTLHTRGPQNPEIITSNSVVSIRGSITPSIISNDYAPTLRASELTTSHLSPRSSQISLGTKAALFGQTLDGNPHMSQNPSTITLPSFVEQERPTPTPPPTLAPPNAATIEAARSFPSSSRSSFQPSGSRSRIENTTPPTTPSSATHLGYDLPSPSVLVFDRPPQLHRSRSSSSRRAGIWHGLATAKLKSAAQAEVKSVRSGTPGERSSWRPRTNSLRRDPLSPLVIPVQTSSFPGDYDPLPFSDRGPLREERHASIVSNNSSRLTSLRQSSQETCLVPAELEGASLTLHANNPTKPTRLSQSPVLGFLHSPSSCASHNESRSRVTSRTASSMSTIPSISAFPPPPGFTPSSREKALSILSYSTSGQPYPFATLRESISVRDAETTSPNKGRASIPLPDADSDAPRLMKTADPCPVLSRFLHSERIGGDDTSARSGISFRIPSLRRLSRVPLGPRQMYVQRTEIVTKTVSPSV